MSLVQIFHYSDRIHCINMSYLSMPADPVMCCTLRWNCFLRKLKPLHICWKHDYVEHILCCHISSILIAFSMKVMMAVFFSWCSASSCLVELYLKIARHTLCFTAGRKKYCGRTSNFLISHVILASILFVVCDSVTSWASRGKEDGDCCYTLHKRGGWAMLQIHFS
jgi:hypothetical protein